MKKRIAILGSTGSIGQQTLSVVRQHPDRFDVVLLSANSRVDILSGQAREFASAHLVICDPEKYPSLQAALPGRAVHAGIDALCDLVQGEDVDIVVAAMVGFSGLRPTLSAIRSGKTIALANKETLVAAGAIVMGEAARRGVQILRIAEARKEDALRHPNWSMGAKITIDSATMMNKGFEVIEARWLFDMPVEKIHVVVHPESVIHSMIEFSDGAVLAQLGSPDMREPIQLALSWPERLTLDNRKLDFGALGNLSFAEPDLEKFPCLSLAFEAIRQGGNLPCALNAANEAAVAAYLRDRIGFYDIPAIAREVLSRTDFADNPSLETIFATHDAAFAAARELIWS